MNFDLVLITQKIAVYSLPILFAITVGEMAHGWAARALGDRTAQMLGRLSLNPLKYVDPVGTIVVPLVSLVLGGFIIGWPKPIPIDIRNFRNLRRDMALSAVAAPVFNFLMAIAWGLLLKFAASMNVQEGLWFGVSQMAEAGILISLVFMLFNLIPLPPLAGGRVLAALLPEAQARVLDRIEPYSFFIFMALLFLGVFGKIITGPLTFLLGMLVNLLGL